jgi:hypothetical protein
MAIEADPISLRRLTIAKQILGDAARQPVELSAVARILAVVAYDLAVETTLKTITISLDGRRVPADNFSGLVEQVERVLAKNGLGDLPGRATIFHVHQTRNDVQHKARYPTREEVSDCRTYARDFLEAVCATVWGFSFAGLSLSALVQDDRARGALLEAEQAIARADLTTAVQSASEALTWALLRVERAIVGKSDPFSKGVVAQDGFGETRVDRDLTSAIKRTQETVLFLALGLEYAEYLRFRSIAGWTQIIPGGRASHHASKTSPDVDDAEFVVAYASDAVIQIEARVGGLDKPFGRDHWY